MNKKIIVSALLLIFLIQAIPLLFWIKDDTMPPSWDQSWHAMLSVNKFNQFFGKTNLTTTELEKIYPTFRHANAYYPPFFHVATIPFYLFLGLEYDSALMTNIFFLLILIISSFFIGKKLHSSKAGLLNAFIVSTIPVYSYLMRDYLIDFSLSSMVSLGLALLLYADNFQNLAYSLLFGLSFGLGMLTKWTYALFLVFPICFALFAFMKKNIFENGWYRLLYNILFTLIAASSVMATWYNYARIKILLPMLKTYSSAGILEGDPSFNSLNGLTYYLFAMLSTYSFFYFLLFVVGAVLLIKYYKKREISIMLIFNLLVVYSFFTILSNKDQRYIVPLYIFLSSITAVGICLINNKKIRYAVIILVITAGLFQNIAYNLQSININYELRGISLLNTQGKHPGSSDIDINEIMLAISNSNKGIPSSVCIISESEILNDINIPYYSIKGNYPASYMVGNGCNPLKFDYTVIGPIEETWRSQLFEQSKSMLQKNIHQFKQIYSVGDVNIYRRT